MKEIPLTQGLVALVDDEDWPLLSQYAWRVLEMEYTNYAVAHAWHNGRDIVIQMHRLIMGMPRMEIDHRDKNGLNNTRGNLRVATHSENTHCKRKRTPGVDSNFRGVRRTRNRKRWRAQIKCKGQEYHLGHFDREEDAARAYDDAAIRLFGDFASLNFPLTIQPSRTYGKKEQNKKTEVTEAPKTS